MSPYWYFIVGIILAIWAFVTVYVVQSRRRSNEDLKHSWVSYFLLWPLILNVDKSKRAGQFLTRREWLGWAIVGMLVAVGMFIGSR
jgi:hypothetical protein